MASFKTDIPIYGTTLYLIICNDVREDYSPWAKVFGEWPGTSDPLACLRYHRFKFGIFIPRDEIKKRNHGLIAHEIFHCTHRMMEYVQQEFDLDNQEAHALLHEYITNWVYGKLKI